MGKQVMSDVEFEALLVRRAELEREHQSLCEACNESYSPFRGERTGVPAKRRDAVWVELCLVNKLINDELAAEEAAEYVTMKVHEAAVDELNPRR